MVVRIRYGLAPRINRRAAAATTDGDEDQAFRAVRRALACELQYGSVARRDDPRRRGIFGVDDRNTAWRVAMQNE
jgi:hypothetical protein